MSDLLEEMTDRLNRAFKPSLLKINDESFKHKGHAGNTGGGHFHLSIQSAQLNGKSRIEAHRMVYQVLEDLIQSKQIHALAIDIQ